MPLGATEPEYGLTLMSCCVIPGEESISDTMPVMPGVRRVAYSYRLPYKSKTCVLTHRFDYPTERFDLLVSGDISMAAGDKLRPEQPVTIEGNQYNRMSAQNFNAGDILKVELPGLPRSSKGVFQWLT